MTDIFEKYVELGGGDFFGDPTSRESATPDGQGRYRHFQKGSIYWIPQKGAHVVHGPIQKKWESLGAEHGNLGYPINDQMSTPDGVGMCCDFERGSIYWTPQRGAYEEYSTLGNPSTNKEFQKKTIYAVFGVWAIISFILLFTGNWVLAIGSILTLLTSLAATLLAYAIIERLL